MICGYLIFLGSSEEILGIHTTLILGGSEQVSGRYQELRHPLVCIVCAKKCLE